MINEASQTHYQVLVIPKTSSWEEIENQYKKLAIQLHPDKNKNDPNATTAFQRLNDAYETLQDPQNRAAYDAEQGGPDFTQAGSGRATTETQCSICLDDVTTLSRVYPCKHDIDLDCIVLWLKEQYNEHHNLERLTCPCCRSFIYTIRHTYQPDGSYSTIDVVARFRRAEQARRDLEQARQDFELAAHNAGQCSCYYFWERQERHLAECYPFWERRLPFFAEMEREEELARVARQQPQSNQSYEERQRTWEREQRVRKYAQWMHFYQQEQQTPEEKQQQDQRNRQEIPNHRVYPQRNYIRHLRLYHSKRDPQPSDPQPPNSLNSNVGENNGNIPGGQNTSASTEEEEEGRQRQPAQLQPQPQPQQEKFVTLEPQPPWVPCAFAGQTFRCVPVGRREKPGRI